MKNLVLIALALFTFTLSAQPGDHPRKEKKEMVDKAKDWTPEQKAELATKKMTLALNLSEAQQKKVYPIQLKIMKNRAQMRLQKDKKSELSSKELFDVQNDRLANKIKTKEQLKAILTAEQFDKLEKKHNSKIKEKGHSINNKSKLLR
jgi:protein CpxP